MQNVCRSLVDFYEYLTLENAKSVKFRYFLQDRDGVITRTEIETLVTNLGGEMDCPHVQVKNICPSKNTPFHYSDCLKCEKRFVF